MTLLIRPPKSVPLDELKAALVGLTPHLLRHLPELPDFGTNSPLSLALLIAEIPWRPFPARSLVSELFATLRPLVAAWGHAARRDLQGFKDVLPVGPKVEPGFSPYLEDAEEVDALLVLQDAGPLIDRARKSLQKKIAYAKRIGFLDSSKSRRRGNALRILEAAVAAAEKELRTVDGVKTYPRGFKEWTTFVRERGAALKAAGLSHGQVAAIFPGKGTKGDPGERPVARARERSRQRTRRARKGSRSPDS